MFNLLFQEAATIERYASAPLARSRLEYLQHCDEQGYAPSTLRVMAHWQMVIVRGLDLSETGTVSVSSIEAAADRWAFREPPDARAQGGHAVRREFIRHATGWLSFAGRLEAPAPAPPRVPYADEMASYADSLRDRGLAETTIRTCCGHATRFLAHCGPDSLPALTMEDLDRAAAARAAGDDCKRATLRADQYAVRGFLRYAASQGWCAPQLADAIQPVRAYRHETLPAGPAREDIERLLAEPVADDEAAARERAVLLLITVYGIRAGEAGRLRLDDLDWERETIRFRRSKPRPRRQLFPLARSVGNAVLHYLRLSSARRGSQRAVFLTLKAPVKPVTADVVYAIVSPRLRALGVPLRHYGPHALRHACATRLLAKGCSMKEIGDYLGHRDPAATAVYAKVDLAGLRRVADFDLEGLL